MTDDEYVHTSPPYGGIMDGELFCSRCGEERDGCVLCAGMERSLTRSGKRAQYYVKSWKYKP